MQTFLLGDESVEYESFSVYIMYSRAVLASAMLFHGNLYSLGAITFHFEFDRPSPIFFRMTSLEAESERRWSAYRADVRTSFP